MKPFHPFGIISPDFGLLHAPVDKDHRPLRQRRIQGILELPFGSGPVVTAIILFQIEMRT
jgi:hypothetical protein